jgi:hypothetical protein
VKNRVHPEFWNFLLSYFLPGAKNAPFYTDNKEKGVETGNRRVADSA